jgi:cellulose synthase/poly-beta-1,6-N-acetylglucosamine synthase-like glycosyltransferase
MQRALLPDEPEKSVEIDSTDAFVIIDADSTVDRNLLRAFDRGLESGHDWIQAYYTVSNPDESWRTRLLTYSFALFNGVLPLGKTQLGVSAAFKGNGMCFSVPGLRRVPWRSHGLVEDMEFSWAVRIAGEKIVFEPDVSVRGAMLAKGGPAAASQRRRWEFGRTETRRAFLGPVLRSKLLGYRAKALFLCELTIPPMGALAVMYVAVAVTDGFFLMRPPPRSSPFVRPFLFGCLGLMTTTLAVHGASPFLTMRLPWRYGLSIVWFPVYIIWKFWVSFRGRPDRWVRTPRESRTEGPAQLAEKLQ